MPRQGQIEYLYDKIEHLFPKELKDYDDNKLWEAISKLSEGDYKYLVAMTFQKQDDVIIKYFQLIKV